MSAVTESTTSAVGPAPTDFGPPDFTYLHMDTPRRPMHWAMVLGIESGDVPVTLESVRDRVRERVGRYEVFRTGVRNGRWRRPQIVVADIVDVDRHVTASEVRDGDQLLRHVADLCETHLPRPDPFWHIEVVTRVDTGAQTIVLRVHHSLSDGIAGAAFAALLADGSDSDLAEFDRFATSPRFRVGSLDSADLADAKKAHHEQWTRGQEGRGPSAWPALTSSGRREVALHSASTRDVRRAARAHDASVHEFLLAAIGRTLSANPPGDTHPDTIRVTLPATLDPSFRHTGNAVSVSLLNLDGRETDLDRQIDRCRSELALFDQRRPYLALAAAGPTPPWPVMRAIVGASMSRMHPDIHIGINPGFSRVRSVLGRRITSLTPLSPLGGYSFSVTSLILGDRVSFGIVADAAALPGYASRFVEAFEGVLAEAGRT
ncbi:wax ester/triacylglycerol synthase domain-containing protein [Williamsia sp. SKLECPSW1]